MAGHGSKTLDKETLWGGGGVSPFGVSYGKMMMWFFLVSDALTFGGLLCAYGYARHMYTGQWPLAEEIFQSFPGLGDGYPLLYVALMTFILIVSSVTMVLAVEAGHRKDKPGVIKWLLLTVVGGFFFVGSQAWEWSHFIHGSHTGTLVLEDGTRAKLTHGHGGPFAHAEKKSKDKLGGDKHGEEHGHEAHADAGHHALTPKDLVVEEGMVLVILGDGEIGTWGDTIYEHGEVVDLVANAEKVIQGANMSVNEYGPQSYANFFFFITGFHGFHVFSGVIINLIILINVMRGVYDKRGHFEMVEKVGLYWHFVDLVWVFVFTFFYLI